MSQENVELIHAALEAWRRGEKTWAAAIGVEVEWTNSAYPAVGSGHRGTGREAFLRFLAQYRETWRPYKATIEELIDAGDDVVAILHESVQASGSGPRSERDVAQVWTVHGGRIVRYRAYRTKEEALEATELRQ
jgi:ketosteroid isomerase-like protein